MQSIITYKKIPIFLALLLNFKHDYWIIYCLVYRREMLYELDLHCSQIICTAPCLSDCEGCGRTFQINSEHSLKIMYF